MVDRTVMQSGRYKAYPEYKDSGVEWLGEIPRHWGLLRGKWRFKSLKEVNRNLQCMDRLALTMRGVIERSIDSDDGLQPSAFTGYQIFEKDDLVFKLIDLENYKTSRVGLVFKKGIMSPAYIRLKPNKGMSSKFFYYFYFDLYLRGIYNQIGGQGVRSALNASDLLEIEICVPSREEQAEIANFLDHEIEKISTLIEKQQRLIELLTEKRKAVISHAVTKGLNPDVPMKDSGVEWLGEVPAHWEYATVRRYLLEHRQGYYTKDSYVDDGVKLLRITDLRKLGNISIKNCPMVPEHSSLRNYLLKEGDVVFARTGGAGSFGVVPQLEEEVAYASYLIRFRFLPRCFNTSYLRYMLIADSFQLAVKQNIHGGVNQNIHAEDIKNTYVACPPIVEQQQISSYLDEQTEKYSQLINKASYQIQLMQERRTALISAAVTGKIDVRDWVKPE